MKPVSKFMTAAIHEAQKAKREGCYAIGAAIVKNGQIVATGSNRIKIDNDPTCHAEIIAIRNATKKFNNRYLKDCILYTTHEPCPMCAAAAIWAKMSGIVFGSRMEDMEEYRQKNGSNEWQWRTIRLKAIDIVGKGDPKLFIVEDFMRDQCVKLFHS